MPPPRSILAALVAVAACAAAAAPAAAAAGDRYAVVIGSSLGQAGEPPLRHAVRDAERMADVLISLGHFLPENVVVLPDPSPERVRDALRRMSARIEAERADGGSVLVVYYSGHADALALHLGPARLPWDELRATVAAAAATTKVLIVDACRSGQATRVKGARLDAPFALPGEDAPPPEGMAILSSATAGEAAQESDALQSSFFTHHLIAALRGVADGNGDGAVTLTEAYQYASERTMASTAATVAGIQHPTYSVDLKGRDELRLTYFDGTTGLAALRLPPDGQYLLWRDGIGGPLAFEGSVGRKGRTVWLQPGTYGIQRRLPDRFEEGTVRLVAKGVTDAGAVRLRRVEYDQLVRKGGGVDGRRVAYAAGLWAGTGSAVIAGLPMPVDVRIGVSADAASLTLDAQVGVARSTVDGDALDSALTTAIVGVGARKVVDVGAVSLSAGLRVGALYADQRYQGDRVAPRRSLLSPTTDTVVRADLHLPSGLFLGVEGGLRILYLRLASPAPAMDVEPETGPASRWYVLAGSGVRW